MYCLSYKAATTATVPVTIGNETKQTKNKNVWQTLMLSKIGIILFYYNSLLCRSKIGLLLHVFELNQISRETNGRTRSVKLQFADFALLHFEVDYCSQVVVTILLFRY